MSLRAGTRARSRRTAPSPAGGQHARRSTAVPAMSQPSPARPEPAAGQPPHQGSRPRRWAARSPRLAARRAAARSQPSWSVGSSCSCTLRPARSGSRFGSLAPVLPPRGPWRVFVAGAMIPRRPVFWRYARRAVGRCPCRSRSRLHLIPRSLKNAGTINQAAMTAAAEPADSTSRAATNGIPLDSPTTRDHVLRDPPSAGNVERLLSRSRVPRRQQATLRTRPLGRAEKIPGGAGGVRSRERS
jgi:hypothetical protein